MTRIATYAASQSMLAHVFRVQTNVNDLQQQVTTEQVAQSYKSLGREADRLNRLETEKSLVARFANGNASLSTRLTVTDTTVTAIGELVRDFRQVLLDKGQGTPLDKSGIDSLQEWAFRSLQHVEAYLNTDVDGRFIFAGTRVTTRPVDFNLTDLTNFQQLYDGAATPFASTSDAHLARIDAAADTAGNANWLYFQQDSTGAGGPSRITATTAMFSGLVPGSMFSLEDTPGNTNDGSYVVEAVDPAGTWVDLVTRKVTNEPLVAATITLPDGTTLAAAATGGLTFNSGASDTIAAATGGSLTGIPVGSKITVSGSTLNNQSFTVTGNDGTTLTIDRHRLVDQGAAGAEVTGHIVARSYYSGDTVHYEHRVDTDRFVDMDLTAVNPAMEKAIRAMGLIAQGAFGTEGGLDQNLGRIDDAIDLLNSALDRAAGTNSLMVTEKPGNLEDVLATIGFQQTILSTAEQRQATEDSRLTSEITGIEGIDRTRVIAELLDQTNALEASYQVMARVRQLSLTNFL